MEKIYDKKKIADCIAGSRYHEVLDSLDIDFYLIKYEKGELVSSPFQRDLLLSNSRFLELVCRSLSAKIGAMTTIDAAPSSLTERVLSYMKYKCADETLKGIEKAAFHLHCSARQLQRILNQCETDGLVKKMGKGTYGLLKFESPEIGQF